MTQQDECSAGLEALPDHIRYSFELVINTSVSEPETLDFEKRTRNGLDLGTTHVNRYPRHQFGSGIRTACTRNIIVKMKHITVRMNSDQHGFSRDLTNDHECNDLIAWILLRGVPKTGTGL